MKKLMAHAAATAAMLTLAGQAQALAIFEDNFDSDSAISVLNFAAFQNWNVDNGTVDYIRNGGFGISCAGNAGGCVDLDGSTGNGGRMLTDSILFVGGEEYRLSVSFSGNQRGGAVDDITFGILGNFLSTHTSIAPNAPFITRSFDFTFGVDSARQVVIETSSADNVGVIVDNVLLECLTCDGGGGEVPAPGVLALMGAGLMGYGVTRKRG
jgi:hypothetical protein